MTLWIDAERVKPEIFDIAVKSVKDAKPFIQDGRITEISINYDNTNYHELFSWMRENNFRIPVKTHLNTLLGSVFK